MNEERLRVLWPSQGWNRTRIKPAWNAITIISIWISEKFLFLCRFYIPGSLYKSSTFLRLQCDVRICPRAMNSGIVYTSTPDGHHFQFLTDSLFQGWVIFNSLLQPYAFSSFVAMWWVPTIITYILQRVCLYTTTSKLVSRHSGWRTKWPINNYAWASSVIYWRFAIIVFHMLSCIQWRASEKTRQQKPMLLAKPIFFLYGPSNTGSETFTVSYSSSAHWDYRYPSVAHPDPSIM